MLEASVKEVEIIKEDVKEIKSCINRYIGYIIGANGFFLLAYKFIIYKNITSEESISITNIFNESNIYNLLHNCIPIFAIILIISLYVIISYKFASHNKYIGYIQLLSQEIKYKTINDNEKLPIKETDYLDNGYKTEDLDESKIPKIILSWDSIMSRFSSRLKTKKDYPKRHYENLDFRLLLSKNSKYSDLNEYEEGTDSYNIVQGFLKYIIYSYYTEKWTHKKYYSKFDVKSWNYPKYIYSLTFLQIILLVLVLWILPYNIIFKIISTLSILILALYFRYDLYHIMKGRKSINYYCWSFFTYRVQLLNTYKIRPIYYSTSFLRYFKSA